MPSLVQFDEQRDQVTVERILRVVFLDVERPNPVSGIELFLYCFAFCTADLLLVLLQCFMMLFFLFLKALEKLKHQLAEAEAALEARKKPPPDTGPRVVGEGLVIDEWVIHCLYHPTTVLFFLYFLLILLTYDDN